MDEATGKLRLVVGLGNPGERYRNTWHNVGAMVVTELARRCNAILKPGRGEFLGAETRIAGLPVMLMAPTPFMNRSGGPVGTWLRYYKVAPADALVVYDDHDLPLGRIRLREDGSAGGHRGIEDIIRIVGSDKIPRLKVGIETELEAAQLADQVLSQISKRYVVEVERIIQVAADAVEMMAREGLLAAMNRYNRAEI